MYVSDNKKFAFIHIPKTGGSTIKNTILSKIKCQRIGEKHGTVHDLGARDNYFICTIVRNPYERIASQYRFRIIREQEQPVEQTPFWVRYPSPWSWVKDNSQLCQSRWVDNRVEVYKFEDIEKAAKKICNYLNIKYEPLRRTTWTNYFGHYDYRKWLDEESITHITKMCDEDFENFGYERWIL